MERYFKFKLREVSSKKVYKGTVIMCFRPVEGEEPIRGYYGFSFKSPTDKVIDEKGMKIAKGRSESERTWLTTLFQDPINQESVIYRILHYVQKASRPIPWIPWGASLEVCEWKEITPSGLKFYTLDEKGELVECGT